MPEADDRGEATLAGEPVTVASIHAALLKAIREGRYRPGGQLPNERLLADQFGASRQQVRDAMLLLSEAGLVTRKVGSGTWLAEDAPLIIERLDATAAGRLAREHSSIEAMEARMIMEPGVAALAARNSTPPHLSDLKAALSAVLEPANWVEFRTRVDLFIRACYAASGNGFLLWTFDQILRARGDGQTDEARHPGTVADIVRRHVHGQLDQIYRAIADGDESRAEAVTRAFLVAVVASAGVG